MRIALAVILSLAVLAVSSFALGQKKPYKEGTRVGDKFLDYDKFNAKTIDGKTITTKDMKGNYVFIDFWATWCGPCRLEFPYLARVEKKLAGDKFMMLGISLDKSVKAIPPFTKEYGVKYPHICDEKVWQSPWVSRYGISGIPANFLLDTDGKILARDLIGYQVEYEAATALGVTSAVIHFFNAEKLVGEEKFEEARAEAEKGFKLEPDNPEAYATVGKVLFAEKKTKEAREWYEKGLEKIDNAISPNVAHVLHQNMAMSYAEEDNWEGVIAEYGKIVDMVEGPMKLSVKRSLVGLLRDSGRNKEAVEQMRIMLEMFNEQPKAFRERYKDARTQIENEIKKLEADLEKPEEPDK